MGFEGVRCIRLSRELISRRCPPDTDALLTLGPPPFHREAEAPTQEEAQRHMAYQATNGGAWPVPSADPVEGSGFAAADFYRAAQDDSHGRPNTLSAGDLLQDADRSSKNS